MDDKIAVLQFIIGNQIFAGSPSALAKILGYKGKMTLYRANQGNISVKTADEIFFRIYENFNISEEELSEIVQTFLYAKTFYDLMTNENDTDNKQWGDQVIVAFLKKDFSSFSENFIRQELPYWETLKTSYQTGILTLFYIKYKKIDPYRNFSKNLSKLMTGLEKLLRSNFPEYLEGYEVINHLKSPDLLNTTSPNKWGLLYYIQIILNYYADPNYKNEAYQLLQLFNFGTLTYWREPSSEYRPGSSLWIMLEYYTTSKLNGIYIVLELTIEKGIPNLSLKNNLYFRFWKQNRDTDLPILQISSFPVREIAYYHYEYAEEKKCFNFWEEENEDRQSIRRNLFQIPGTLQLIDPSKPTANSQEKRWIKAIQEIDPDLLDKYFKQIGEKELNVKIRDEYEIENVIIDRHHLILEIKKDEPTSSRYRIPLHAYSFLPGIAPHQNIIVTQHKDNKLYIQWLEPNYCIPFSEFEQLKKNKTEV